ncbi:MAG: dipeptidase [Planctomycetota bacterium]|jgi:membrane dipeptidase
MLFKRAFSLLLSALLLTALAGCAPPPMTERQIIARATAIHKKALTLDSHVDIKPLYATKKLDPGIDNPKLKCDLVKMNKGDVDGVFLAVYVAQKQRNTEGYKRAYDEAMVKFNAIGRLAEEMYPERCELATSADDVKRIARTGKRAIMIGMENGYPIGKDLSNVEKFYNLGARYITLCHNGHNAICDSCNPRAKLGDSKAEHDGLSEFGRKVVAQMNRLGVMADVSHLSVKSFWDLIEVSKAPIIASHSGCRALTDHPRNLYDDQLMALAKKGGVVQLVTYKGFLKDSSGKADIKTYVNHIDHAVKVAGIDHVGIGSDFDGGGGVDGFNDHSEALNVTIELLRRGYRKKDILKIWGANFLRVWRKTEKIAQEIQKNSK